MVDHWRVRIFHSEPARIAAIDTTTDILSCRIGTTEKNSSLFQGGPILFPPEDHTSTRTLRRTEATILRRYYAQSLPSGGPRSRYTNRASNFGFHARRAGSRAFLRTNSKCVVGTGRRRPLRGDVDCGENVVVGGRRKGEARSGGARSWSFRPM